MNDTPELQRDLRIAAIVLQAALWIGFPVRPIEIDPSISTQDGAEVIEIDREPPAPTALPPAAELVTDRDRPTMLRQMTVLVIDEDSVAINRDMAASICRTVRAAAGAGERT